MNAESIRSYCLAKEDAEEGFPFGEGALVFKVAGKMFLLLSLDAMPVSFNAKCDPDRALELREEHESIIPGYHMNKKHWNTVIVDGSLGDKLIKELIDHSYDLVKPKTKKK
ncbi:MmcQ/YjbR family DNA-binding protein [Taibaiella helva]|uniref:MmcQ/YjbR family DNA-binding protein n=1 Tax=Taibaiella helva TaxID=2301235 RepID=UPI000E57F7D8|nr:MmcQ/YjbR family DNA-binding protein [Taibaiella helva]